MTLKCQSRIVKTFKTKKAECRWPEIPGGLQDNFKLIPNPDAADLPVCGGDVTITVDAIDEPDWGGTYAKLDVKATCSRCRQPYFPGVHKMVGALSLSDFVTELVTEALVARQRAYVLDEKRALAAKPTLTLHDRERLRLLDEMLSPVETPLTSAQQEQEQQLAREILAKDGAQ